LKAPGSGTALGIKLHMPGLEPSLSLVLYSTAKGGAGTGAGGGVMLACGAKYIRERKAGAGYWRWVLVLAWCWCWRGAGAGSEAHQGKGGGGMKRNKSILVRLTEQEQAELIQAVEDWNQSRESWQDEMSISRYIREAIEEKIDREKRKRKRNT